MVSKGAISVIPINLVVPDPPFFTIQLRNRIGWPSDLLFRVRQFA